MLDFIRVLKVEELSAHKAIQTNLVTPVSLAWIRTSWLLFCLATQVFKFIYEADYHPVYTIMFLTNLSFYSLIGYLVVSTYFSWRVVIDSQYQPWINSHWIFKISYFIWYQACLLINLIVTLVFWSFLAKKQITSQSTPQYVYIQVATHLFNLIIYICEVIFSGNPVVLTHYPIILFIALLYVPYAILLHRIFGIWAYFFLNYEEYPVLFIEVIFGLIFSSMVFHGILYYIHQWRDNRFISQAQCREYQETGMKMIEEP